MNKNKKGQFTLDGWIKDEKATLNKVEYINTFVFLSKSVALNLFLATTFSLFQTHTHTRLETIR